MTTATVRKWVIGLTGAAINGALSGITVVIVDPKTFNPFDGGFQKLGLVMITMGLFGAGLYAKEHPLKLEDDTDGIA